MRSKPILGLGKRKWATPCSERRQTALGTGHYKTPILIDWTTPDVPAMRVKELSNPKHVVGMTGLRAISHVVGDS